MIIRRVVLVLLIASGLWVGVWFSLSARAQTPSVDKPDKIIVVLKPVERTGKWISVTRALRDRFSADGLVDLKPLGFGGPVPGSETYLGFVAPGADIGRLMSQIERSPLVLRAELDVQRHFLSIDPTTGPNDPEFPSQSYYFSIGAVAMWAKGLTGISATNPITVAVIDTGADLAHPDLVNNIITGYDFIASNTTPQDQAGHGSMVAGVIGAAINNGIGVAGIGGGDTQANVMGLRLMPLRVAVNAGDHVDCAMSARAIISATMLGARVINISYGGYNFCQTELDAVQGAYDHGIAIVAGAGNDYTSTLFYPAAYGAGTNDRLVIAVCGLAPSGLKADQSNYGAWVDVCAPFSNIRSTTINGGYDTARGTSLSAPFVSGLIGVLMSNYRWSRERAISIVLASADNVDAINYPGYQGQLGTGRINAERASAMVHAVYMPLMLK